MNQSSPPVFVRQQLLIDEKVQGALLKRAGFYGVVCALYFIIILIFAEVMSHQDVGLGEAIIGFLEEAIYWLPGLLVMVPLIAYDMMKHSNRFTGPVFHLRREMQHLIAGESERPLEVRDEDYWSELAGEFNEIRNELLELRKAKLEPTVPDAEIKNQLFDDSSEETRKIV